MVVVEKMTRCAFVNSYLLFLLYATKRYVCFRYVKNWNTNHRTMTIAVITLVMTMLVFCMLGTIEAPNTYTAKETSP